MVSFKFFLTSLIFAASLFANMDEDSLRFYKDGVYNTTSLINRYLRDGLQETTLDQYKDKYLLMADIKNLSFVDIIMYENLAQKKQIMDVKIVKKLPSGELFMVFGSYDRLADAEMVQNILTEVSVPTEIRQHNKMGESYAVYPLIVKKYLGDIRELIKDMPVKVVKIEKTIAKDGSSCQPPAPQLPLLPQNKSIDESSLLSEFEAIKESWESGGEIPNEPYTYIAIKKTSGVLLGKKNYYQLGEKIGCFKLVNITYDKDLEVCTIYLLAPNGKTFKASKKISKKIIVQPKAKAQSSQTAKVTHIVVKTTPKKKCGNGVESDFCPDVDVKPSLDAPIGTKSSGGTVRCNFSQISLVKSGSKSVKISETPYANKELDVSTIAPNNGYVGVKASGMPMIFLRESTFNEKCIK